MEKILVAYDGSQNSKKALEQAVELVRYSKASMIVATVIPDVMFIVADKSIEIPDETREHSKNMINKVVRELRGEGITVEGVVLAGDVATELLKVADDRGCDLIVMGRRGLNNVDSFLIGSITEKVVKHTHFSVWVVV